MEPTSKGKRPARTNTQRVNAVRERRAALGIQRREICAHPLDWPAIKAFSKRLLDERIRSKKADEQINTGDSK